MSKSQSQHISWKNILLNEFKKDYFIKLRQFLLDEYKTNTIYPNKNLIFNALNLCSFDNTKVVILGLDPYINENQAHGLAFSTLDTKLPPSLKNIYKELNIKSKSGNLTNWAKQGVLLLNSILTVQAGKTNSHKNKGWEQFTDFIIKYISENKENIVFILWGNTAIDKLDLINNNKHLIITSSHPSPLSCNKTDKPFFGSNCFTRANEYLEKNNITRINWMVNDS